MHVGCPSQACCVLCSPARARTRGVHQASRRPLPTGPVSPAAAASPPPLLGPTPLEQPPPPPPGLSRLSWAAALYQWLRVTEDRVLVTLKKNDMVPLSNAASERDAQAM